MAMDNITSNNNANFYWWFGVVEDRNDPLRLGRCRVRIIGYHTEDNEILPTEDLPWAMPVMPANSAGTSGVGWSPTGAVEGSWVVGFFADGENGQHPMFFGTVGSIPGGLRAGDCPPDSGPGSPSDGATTDGSDAGTGTFVEPKGDAKNVESWFEKFLDINGPQLSNWGPTAKAAIMAQCHKETGGFKWFEEFASGEAYEGNVRNLGNTQPGDGPRFKGRGFIQITGRANYKKGGDYIKVDLISNPKLAAQKEAAAKLVIYFFKVGNARSIGKEDKWNDNTAVTKKVNGARAKQSTINERLALFNAYKKKYGVA